MLKLEHLLWAPAIALAIWAWVPPLFHLLGLSRYRFTPSEDPAEADPPPGDPEFRCRYEELLARGFRPLGAVRETQWFLPVEWRKTFLVRCYLSADETCIACLYRLGTGEAVRVCLTTFTGDGGKVQTAMPGAEIQELVDNFVRQEVQGGDLDIMLGRHHAAVQLFLEKKGVTLVRASLPEFAAWDEDNTRRQMSGIGLSGLTMTPVLFYLGPCFGIYTYLQRQPDRPISWAIVLLTGGICYLTFMKVIFPGLCNQELHRTNPPPKLHPDSVSQE